MGRGGRGEYSIGKLLTKNGFNIELHVFLCASIIHFLSNDGLYDVGGYIRSDVGSYGGSIYCSSQKNAIVTISKMHLSQNFEPLQVKWTNENCTYYLEHIYKIIST